MLETAIKNVHEKMSVGDAKWSVAHSRWMSNFVAREEAARLRQKLEKLLRREKPSDIAELVETNRVITEDSVREAVPEVVKTLMELGVERLLVEDGRRKWNETRELRKK